MIDLNKLTQAPWVVTKDLEDRMNSGDENGCLVIENDGSDGDGGSHIAFMYSDSPDNAAFIVLARNALEVMMRRGWYALPANFTKWYVAGHGDLNNMKSRIEDIIPDDHVFNDPFTALVEADRWYRENVELEKPEGHGVG